MDFLNYTFVLLNEALVSFSRIVLSYGMDISVCLLWIGLSIATFNFFFSNFNMTTPLSGFVIKALKKGKYLNQGALGGVLYKWHKMKMIVQLGQLLVEVEDNNLDTAVDPEMARKRWKRALLETITKRTFHWNHSKNLCHPNPLKARQARRAFVGEEEWNNFKELSPQKRRIIYKLAAKL